MKNEYLKKFKKVFNTCSFVIDKIGFLPCDNRAQEAGSYFLVQNNLIAQTLYYIYNPKPIQEISSVNSNTVMFDFCSAFILVRNLFESYINIYYLLIDPKTEEERIFRLNLWNRHGESERIKIYKQYYQDKYDEKESEKNYKYFTNEIVSSNYFNCLTPGEQESIINSDKWIKEKEIYFRSRKAGIDDSHSDFLYRFLSNYAHAESFALLQIVMVRTMDEIETEMHISQYYASAFLSLSLKIYSEISTLANDLIKDDTEINEIIEESKETLGLSFQEMMEEKNKLNNK